MLARIFLLIPSLRERPIINKSFRLVRKGSREGGGELRRSGFANGRELNVTSASELLFQPVFYGYRPG